MNIVEIEFVLCEFVEKFFDLVSFVFEFLCIYEVFKVIVIKLC